jgi:thymidine kinase
LFLELRGSSRPGWLEVVTGSMFSGKSEELIRRLRRAQIARQRVQVFKPAIDNRFEEGHITSHSAMRIPSDNVTSSRELLELVQPDTEVVGIDEGQFFDVELPAVCNTLADRGIRVIVAGLDQDYLGKPFEPMPQLLAIAEYITKTLAICMVCGGPANHTQRLVASRERVLVGGLVVVGRPGPQGRLRLARLAFDELRPPRVHRGVGPSAPYVRVSSPAP